MPAEPPSASGATEVRELDKATKLDDSLNDALANEPVHGG